MSVPKIDITATQHRQRVSTKTVDIDANAWKDMRVLEASVSILMSVSAE
uniref:F5/8 type C domain-containing protein n=1 Tax=Angiostrongylus cantonensis TaxID=6313 RepID=A0A0K0CYX5_ANGCA